MTEWPPSPGAVAPDVAAPLGALFAADPFELRWSLTGTAAVRVLAPHGPVAARHAEPNDPAAPWCASARCGTAVGWLLAGEPPVAGVAAGRAALQAAVDRHTALVLQRLAAERAAMGSELLEALTHRLRTDVTTLQAVAEGTLAGLFSDAEGEEVAREVKEVGREAQRRLSAAREAMTALRPAAASEPAQIAETLRSELDGLGAAVAVHEPAGELPRAALPGAGWAACARMLAKALATDPRLGGAEAAITIVADPVGWAVVAGPAAAEGRPIAWTERMLGPLAGAGHVAVAGGGSAAAAELDGDGLVVRLTVPAAPSLPVSTI
jgi:signal transduction histidine kinase